MKTLVSGQDFVITYYDYHFLFEGDFITPQNVDDTYQKVFEKLTDLFNQNSKQITLSFKIKEHFSHVTTSVFMKILRLLVEHKKSTNAEILVNWYYQEEDDDIYYAGIDFKDEFEEYLPINVSPS